MKREQLVKMYPWAGQAGVVDFAEKFTEDEWKILNEENMGKFLSENEFSKILIAGIMLSLAEAKNSSIDFKAAVKRVMTYTAGDRLYKIEAPESDYPDQLRAFPAWLSRTNKLKHIVNYFSDNQICIMTVYARPELVNHPDLIGLCLNLLLTKACRGSPDRIQEVTDSAFTTLFLSVQTEFLANIKATTPRLNNQLTDLMGPSSSVFDQQRLHEQANQIIRKYVTEYKSVHVPIPSDGIMRAKALECALRNAANKGHLPELMSISPLIGNINAASLSNGKTGLHYAAITASKTGDRTCFDFLLSHPKINIDAVDHHGKTAVEYWDFENMPDPSLKKMLVEVQLRKAQTQSEASSSTYCGFDSSALMKAFR